MKPWRFEFVEIGFLFGSPGLLGLPFAALAARLGPIELHSGSSFALFWFLVGSFGCRLIFC